MKNFDPVYPNNGFNHGFVQSLVSLFIFFIIVGCQRGEQKNEEQIKPSGSQVVKGLGRDLPAHIKRITHFGQRGEWSHDGKKILFLERTYGDVYEVTLSTGVIRPVSHHFYHEGFVRANYLSNGDILLSGAPNFDAENPGASRQKTAELWVMDKSLEEEPVALGTRCSEGPAVSRNNLTIAWTIDHENYPDSLPEGVSQIWTGDIQYEEETPKLTNKKLVLDSRDLSFEAALETQDFRQPEENELIFSAYGFQGTEVMGLNLETGETTNYSQHPGYEEPEGIFPGGAFTTVESDRHTDGKGYQFIDVYKLRLDGSGEMERLTFFNDNSDFKGSNPAISDDGRFMVFQMAKVGDPAGVGRGLFIYDLEKVKAN